MLFDPAASALCARPKRAPAEVAAEMDEDAENDATLDACGGETHWHVETRCVACVWRVMGDQCPSRADRRSVLI